jgi:hypothetical protein
MYKALIPLVFALFRLSTNAEILGGPIFNATTGHAYYILAADSWTNSERAAIALGGHLVTINNAAEQDWIFTTFAAFGGVARDLWIGLNDAQLEGTFVWENGEPVSYTKWAQNEPNNGGGVEHFARIRSDASGQWADTANSWPNVNGVVEVVPFPQAKEVWDANAGLTILKTSPLHSSGIYDARDAFGGTFGSNDHDVVFSDTPPADGGMYYIEWRTPTPVTVKSIRLYTGAGDPSGREIGYFWIKAKPIGGSSFSLDVWGFYPLHHPYVLLPNGALAEGNLFRPVTAQEFRAEFLAYSSQSLMGPRVVELDGFDQYLPINSLPVTGQLAMLVKWPISTNTVQVQWSSALNPEGWFDLGPSVSGGLGQIMDPIADEKRFYRVLELK